MGLFGTAGIRGHVGDEVTSSVALEVGRAVGLDARGEAGGSTVVVGRDGRVTGAGLGDAVVAGLETVGADVVRVGTVPTPALAYASRGRRGVMVTASHNPPMDNGFKLFVDGVEYDGDAEQRVADRVESGVETREWAEWTTSATTTVLDAYRNHVIEYARGHGAPLDGFSVVVDCGNGTASHSTPAILDRLGAHVVTLHGHVDGSFPGRPSKPTPETLTGCRSFLADGDFDLGVAHDGDGDRVVFLDGAGEIVHEDTVVAILARHYVDQADGSSPVVVTTPNASARIDEQVRAVGGETVRTALGTLHEEVARQRDAGASVVFAGEPWKHIHPALGGWIDGAASAAVFARLVASDGLAELRGPVTERPYRKKSVDCPDPLKDAVMERVVAAVPELFDGGEVSTAYGVRVTRSDGSWVLVRPSGTEPKLRIYVEADDVDTVLDSVTETVQSLVAEAE